VNRCRQGEALTWIVVIVVLLCIAGGGLLYWQHHRAAAAGNHRRPVKLAGPTASIDLGDCVVRELVRVKPGGFMRGSPSTEPDHDGSEEPQHKVTIGKPFYIGKFEVTQAQWRVKKGDQSAFKGDRMPADGVSWGDATNWCKEISKELNVTVRLPTE